MIKIFHHFYHIVLTCIIALAWLSLMLVVLGQKIVFAAPTAGQYPTQVLSSKSTLVPAAVGTSTVVTYYSSVDGVALEYLEYLPTGYNPALAYPLVILLHGAGGNMNQYDTPAWHQAADNHGYILAMIHARTLPGYSANRMTFYMNGVLAPGEQDVLDLIPVVSSRHLVDPNRLYLGGYSMGGIGALNIVTLNPGIFAAAAPGVAISDLFQQWDYNPAAVAPNFATLLGGGYGQSVITDTYWYQNSPRYLLPNLMHTPIRILHGLTDTLVPNTTSLWPYMQSRHIVDTPGYVDSRGRALTLPELRATWPGAYYEEHFWPNANHGGASLNWLPEDIFSFFDAPQRLTNPLTVAFTTYEDRHTRAYWLQLNLTKPWMATPGLVYATRNPLTNSVQLQITGSMTLTLDMVPMGLTNAAPLTVIVKPSGAPPSGDMALVLSDTWPTGPGVVYAVTCNGAALSAGDYTLTATRFTLLRRPTNAVHTYTITIQSTTAGQFKVYLPVVLNIIPPH